jgi:fucose permease
MATAEASTAGSNVRLVRALTCLMFFMFAMTTDSVGLIIPQVIAEYHLSMATAGALQYGSMLGIAFAGLGLGFLADRLGRRRAILMGLLLFAATAFLFPWASSFLRVLALTTVAGMAIGVFKTGAVALVGDLSADARQLTSTMNLVEGFFGVGAIIGPLIVTALIERGTSWRFLYVIAGTLSVVLALIALRTRYPQVEKPAEQKAASLGHTLRLLPNRYVLGFSALAFTYVVVECAIYVWMPTLLAEYHGSWLALVGYALPAFFVMRAAGRFLGAWLLGRVEWSTALMLCAIAIFCCFAGASLGGVSAALFLLPVSGLFMSILYPTINSKGIGCFGAAEQGAAAGIILFFTCLGAFLGPLSMGLVSDALGSASYGFVVATVAAGVFAAGLVVNWLSKPAHAQLARYEATHGA